jgi:cell division protein FtsB
MILRRVIAHFRKQEWTAIFLDFLIVVAGILIAFQITAWNERREDRETEAQYLAQLIEDLRADLVEIDNIRRTCEIRMAALERILEFAQVEPRRTHIYDVRTVIFDTVPPFESDDPFEANLQLTNKPELDGARQTFEALISTGDFGLIRNHRLARQIQTYYAEMDEANNLEDAVADQLRDVNASRYRLGVSPVGRVTIEELGSLAVSDPQFSAELETYWAGSAYQARWMKRMRQNAEALIDAITEDSSK